MNEYVLLSFWDLEPLEFARLGPKQAVRGPDLLGNLHVPGHAFHGGVTALGRECGPSMPV